MPADRSGYAAGWSAGQRKVTQQVIAPGVFGIFMVALLGEPATRHHAAAFLFVGRGGRFPAQR